MSSELPFNQGDRVKPKTGTRWTLIGLEDQEYLVTECFAEKFCQTGFKVRVEGQYRTFDSGWFEKFPEQSGIGDTANVSGEID